MLWWAGVVALAYGFINIASHRGASDLAAVPPPRPVYIQPTPTPVPTPTPFPSTDAEHAFKDGFLRGYDTGYDDGYDAARDEESPLERSDADYPPDYY